MTTLLQIQSLQETWSLETCPLETWHPASWDTFVKIADDGASAKLKSYYYDGRMRFELMLVLIGRLGSMSFSLICLTMWGDGRCDSLGDVGGEFG